MRARLRPLLLCSLLVATDADAQGLPSTAPATQTRVAPARTPAPPPRRESTPVPTPRPRVMPMPTTLEQRPQPPVPVRGAARTQDAAEPAAKKKPVRADAQVKVYDRHGRLLPGMRAAGPNRVLDTRTGRYHDTVPMGDGRRIVR